MPGRRHVKGASKKGQRMYEHIMQGGARKRYGKRAKQVAARIVNKRKSKKSR